MSKGAGLWAGEESCYTYYYTFKYITKKVSRMIATMGIFS
jgi:hypothetical protein